MSLQYSEGPVFLVPLRTLYPARCRALQPPKKSIARLFFGPRLKSKTSGKPLTTPKLLDATRVKQP